MNDHSLFCNIIAGGDQLLFSLQFYYTDTTGRNFIDSF